MKNLINIACKINIQSTYKKDKILQDIIYILFSLQYNDNFILDPNDTSGVGREYAFAYDVSQMSNFTRLFINIYNIASHIKSLTHPQEAEEKAAKEAEEKAAQEGEDSMSDISQSGTDTDDNRNLRSLDPPPAKSRSFFLNKTNPKKTAEAYCQVIRGCYKPYTNTFKILLDEIVYLFETISKKIYVTDKRIEKLQEQEQERLNNVDYWFPSAKAFITSSSIDSNFTCNFKNTRNTIYYKGYGYGDKI